MGVWTPVEAPGSRGRRSWLFDVTAALGALVVSGVYVTAAPDLPIAAAIAIIVALALPLVVRRIWPLPVFSATLLIAVACGWWAMQVVWSPALGIALYTVAVLRPRRDALAAAALLSVAAAASSVRVFGGSWWASAASLIAAIVAATAFGLYIATRHALIEQLRDNARRLERERDQQSSLAAAAERTRIAREMHDILAHHLTVMVTLSDGASAQVGSAPEIAAEVIRTVSATGPRALSDTRNLLGVLRDADTAGTATAAALTPLPDLDSVPDLVERIRAAGLPVRFEIEGSPPAAAAGHQLACYRVVREALTNTMKHAGPNASAHVRIRYLDDAIHVDVTDDVAGPAVSKSGPSTTEPGHGLIGMRERIEALGGQLKSGARRPRGWLVSACLPLPTDGSERQT